MIPLLVAKLKEFERRKAAKALIARRLRRRVDEGGWVVTAEDIEPAIYPPGPRADDAPTADVSVDAASEEADE